MESECLGSHYGEKEEGAMTFLSIPFRRSKRSSQHYLFFLVFAFGQV